MQDFVLTRCGGGTISPAQVLRTAHGQIKELSAMEQKPGGEWIYTSMIYPQRNQLTLVEEIKALCPEEAFTKDLLHHICTILAIRQCIAYYCIVTNICELFYRTNYNMYIIIDVSIYIYIYTS
eukprot:GHVR01037979.1.p1 GENE.GHVR01037979.1~~GHVR01037979.1.p1  ORF type:complete len:123 (+),score=8.09 GHVR01037979.1:275-643(+)